MDVTIGSDRLTSTLCSLDNFIFDTRFCVIFAFRSMASSYLIDYACGHWMKRSLVRLGIGCRYSYCDQDNTLHDMVSADWKLNGESIFAFNLVPAMREHLQNEN